MANKYDTGELVTRRGAQPVAPAVRADAAAPSQNKYEAPSQNKYDTGMLVTRRGAQPVASTPSPQEALASPERRQAQAYLDQHPEAQEGYAKSLGRKFATGLGMGWADELTAGFAAAKGAIGDTISGQGPGLAERYELERAMQQEMAQRAGDQTGTAGTVAELAGGVAGGLVGGEALGAANTLGGALRAGAAVGAVQGAGDGEGGLGSRVRGALDGAEIGAAGGVVGHGVGKAVQGVAARMNPGQLQAPAPNAEALRQQAKALYDQFENSGGRYSREALRDLRLQSMRALDDIGWTPGADAHVDSIVKRIDNMSGGYGPHEIRPKDMQNLRSAAIGVTKSMEPKVRGFGYALSNTIDDSIDNIAQRPGFVLNGGVDTPAFHEANQLYKQASKAQVLENNIDRGVRQAGVTYSGGNETNKILQAVNKTYNELTKHGRKLTPDEEKAFRAVTNPSIGERALRSVGKMKLGGGAGANFLNLLGASTTGPAWAVVPAVAQVADTIANRTARRNAEDVGRIIRNGGRSRPRYTPAPPTAVQAGMSAASTRLSGPFAELLYSATGKPAPVKGKR